MERVNFKVAKAIKDAGYPQKGCWWFSNDGKVKVCYSESDLDEIGYIAAPYYVEVLFWLWKTKKAELTLGYGTRINDVDETLYCFPLTYHCKSHPDMKYIILNMDYNIEKCCSHGYKHEHADPEEAIINTINFLVDNNLIH